MRPARLPLLLLSSPHPPTYLFALLVVVADNVPQTIAIVVVAVVAVVCYRFHSCSNQFDV